MNTDFNIINFYRQSIKYMPYSLQALGAAPKNFRNWLIRTMWALRERPLKRQA